MNQNDYRLKWELSEDKSYYGIRQVAYAEKPCNPEHQHMNIYVPAAYLYSDGSVNPKGKCGRYTAETAPMVLFNHCSGWRSSKPGKVWIDFIKEGFIHVELGARSFDLGGIGKAPAPCVDQKAAVRMLRLLGSAIPGDKDRMVSVGISGGGQMSSILGASGDMEDYYPALYEMGAPGVELTPQGRYVSTISDAIFASQCYCPIADIDHADLAYAWQRFDDPEINYEDFHFEGVRTLSPFKLALQEDLAQAWAAYVNSLHLSNDAGKPLNFPRDTDGHFLLREGSYYEQMLDNISDALNAYVNFHSKKDGRVEVTTYTEGKAQTVIYPNADAYISALPNHSEWIRKTEHGYRITDMRCFCRGTGLIRGKDCPGFDAFHYIAENPAFGKPEEQAVHFDRSAAEVMQENYHRYTGMKGFDECDVDAYIHEAMREDIARQTFLLNATGILTGIAEHKISAKPSRFWRTRNGSADEHTSFGIAYNLAMAAKAAGCIADYALVWNEPHTMADGNGTGSFIQWIHDICSLSDTQNPIEEGR